MKRPQAPSTPLLLAAVLWAVQLFALLFSHQLSWLGVGLAAAATILAAWKQHRHGGLDQRGTLYLVLCIACAVLWGLVLLLRG